MSNLKILIVEDELITIELIRDILVSRGYEITGAVASSEEALKSVAAVRPDLVLCDIQIKGSMDGIGLAGVINRDYDLPVIYLTAFADDKTVERAKKTYSYGYVIKPFTQVELLTAIEIGLYKHDSDRKIKQSEERFRSLFETMKDAAYIRTIDGKFAEINQALIDLLGYTREEWSRMQVGNIYVKPDDQFIFQREMELNGFVKDFETMLRRKEGAVLSVLITATMMAAPEGKGQIIRGIIRDITGQKRAEESLRESENRYRTLFETMRDPIYIHTIDGMLLDFNPALLELYGYSRDEALEINVKDVFVDPVDNTRFFSEIKKIGYIKDFETRHYRKNKNIIHCSISATTINSNDGSVVAVRGIIRDITRHKQAEKALHESENRYRAIFDGSLNLIYIHDFEGKFLDANDAALELLGYTRKEMPSLSFNNLLSRDQLQKAMDQIRQILKEGGQSEIKEFQLQTKKGKSIFVEISASLLYHDGKPYAIMGVGRDNTERKKYIEELTIAQAENTNLINSISSIIIGVSTKDVITHWNRMAEETFGISAENALGNSILGFNIQWDWTEIYVGISACLAEKSPVFLDDIKFVDRNGLEGILGITINPIKGIADESEGFLIYGKNITDKRLMEQQLQQSSKLATIGEIATGIAHELNQPLNVIKMASQYLRDSVTDKYYTDDFIKERVDKIVAQVDRAARIITHLREFGRKSDFLPRSIDANLPIRMAFDLLGEQLRLHSIKVSMDLDPSLPPINGDSQKLEQVFINLIVNAKDALEETSAPGKENIISVKSFRRDPERAIQIEFSDNGPGIPAHVVDKIFDPFFTTKEVGKGTGLGLSISYGIIKTHQGTIDVKTGSSGATFVIQLPAYDKSLDLLQETG